MAKLKLKINIFDLIALVALIVATFFVFSAWNHKPFLGSKNVLVEIRVSNQPSISALLPKISSQGTVFYSGTKYPVKQVSFRTTNDDSGKIEFLYITIQGPGDIVEGDSIFNGQRIFINQKTEIRGDYQAQGEITDFHYVN